ncbi:MAG: hypothetical protein FWF59_07560 [Turicibacter sp.]|nr:hypothetical protein [Turicibacter sp.]
MATETKIFNVNPGEDADVINTMANFGWELFGTQEIHNQKSESVETTKMDGTTRIDTTITTMHYIRITLQRDNGREAYSNLVQLEKEFFSLNTGNPTNVEKGSNLPAYLTTAVFLGVSFLSFKIITWLWTSAFWIPLFLSIIISSFVGGTFMNSEYYQSNEKLKQDCQEAWEAHNAPMFQRREEILKEAKALL